MAEYELYHHGIKGQKWGVRRTRAQLGYPVGATRKKIKAIKYEGANEMKRLKLKGREDARIAKTTAKLQARLDKRANKNADKIDAINRKYLKPKVKTISEMSDNELRECINRIRLENDYKSLTVESKVKGSGFVKSFAKDAVKPALISAGKDLINNFVKDKVGKKLGLSGDDLSNLKKEVTKMELEKRKAMAEDYFKDRANPK